MKQTLLLSTLVIITIVVLASFGYVPAEWVGIKIPVHNISDSVAANALFVCPAASPVFDGISKAMLNYRNQITMIFFFFFMIFLATTAWGFYQNLIKDEFDQNKYLPAFFIGKWLFWISIVVMILMYTPNHFRTVKVTGSAEKWVLCESTSAGSRPVRANAVNPR